jgi:lipopolysaccharide export system protein LptA
VRPIYFHFFSNEEFNNVKSPLRRWIVPEKSGQRECNKCQMMLVTLFVVSCLSLSQQSDLIILQNADEFAGKRLENGEDVRELTGNVRFRQGDAKVWCDKAIQFITRNEVELIGNVKVVRDTITLTSKHGRYFGNLHKADGEGNVKLKTPHVILYADIGTYYLDEKRAFFQRNVKVIDSTSIIYCEQLTYYEKQRKSEAMLNVRIVNPNDNVTMFGNYLIHSDSTRYSKMTDNPRMIQIDTTEKGEIDTLAVKSMVMEAFDDSVKKTIIKDSVVIVRGRLAARSGLVKYFRQNEIIELYFNPIVWYEENQVTGDTIFLSLEKNRLKTASIRTRAFVLSRSDSTFPNRYNQLTGRMIRMTFKENKLQETFVERNAISLYFLYNDSTGNGVNKTSGDAITMKFDAGKPNTIYVIKGIEGSFYPENLLKKDEAQYNLDGFLIRNDRPKFTTVFPTKPKL